MAILGFGKKKEEGFAGNFNIGAPLPPTLPPLPGGGKIPQPGDFPSPPKAGVGTAGPEPGYQMPSMGAGMSENEEGFGAGGQSQLPIGPPLTPPKVSELPPLMGGQENAFSSAPSRMQSFPPTPPLPRAESKPTLVESGGMGISIGEDQSKEIIDEHMAVSVRPPKTVPREASSLAGAQMPKPVIIPRRVEAPHMISEEVVEEKVGRRVFSGAESSVKPTMYIRVKNYRQVKSNIKRLKEVLNNIIGNLEALSEVERSEEDKVRKAESTMRKAERVVDDINRIFSEPIE